MNYDYSAIRRAPMSSTACKVASRKAAPSPVRFEVWMLSGIEWQQRIPIQTDNGKYRVEIARARTRETD